MITILQSKIYIRFTDILLFGLFDTDGGHAVA
jgi:hypothetical protein